MTDNTENLAAVNRPITDDERTLIKQLCIYCVADQTGVTNEAAVAALENIIETEGIYMHGDSYNVWVKVGTEGDGKDHRTLVHVTREWLAFYAANPDEPLDFDQHRVFIKEGKGDK